ncbi:MAG TPA: hypothetical protein VF631_07035 [Allosphingosinicella sp.]|uniref:hypothetical protein n=1 Tax=Allosphingosinicella sp. TaxID=2823234 RepID=UPI002F283545
MRLPIIAAFPALLLAGCAGYAIDYTKSRENILGPELARYGLSESQARCVNESLSKRLAKGQLGVLTRTTRLVKRGYTDPERLMVQDLLYVATFVKDRKVAAELSRASASCNLLTNPAIASVAPAPSAATVAAGSSAAAATPVTPSARGSSWLNLGAAPTGQAIAIDAASVQDRPGHREAWFRITNPGDTGPTGASYRLQIDCSGRTINPMALRKYGKDGAVSDEKDYGPGGEGALKVEGGTVMEIAYLALCT